MSRCFPYPLPAHTLHSAKNEALVESIKLQKDKQSEEEKRREKKDKRKERKEKKKERKEKRKEKKDKINQNSDKSDIVKDHIGLKTRSDSKDQLFFQKRRETKSEQFEQSSLTEEHGLPDSLPVPSSSYDSTENNNKRKRHSSPVDGSKGRGKAILIRLPSKRKSEFHSSANEQQCCSISRQTNCSTQHKDDTRDRPESCNVEQRRNNGEEICSTSGQNIVPGERRMSNAAVNPMQGVELQYKLLLDNWFPPRLEDTSVYPVESDWLYQDAGGKRQRGECPRSSEVWARAEYLHEIDAYALPFVVPY